MSTTNGRDTNGSVSVAGGWLGTYHYGGLQAMRAPVRFEASLSSPAPGAGQFSGEIIDDCALGTARISGSQSGLTVYFEKSYVAKRRAVAASPVEYAGSLSDDGKVMRGTWRIAIKVGDVCVSKAQGTWHARRMWAEEEAQAERTAEDSVYAVNVLDEPAVAVR